MKIITKKQGIATVLGMLIFIGVLFTVVIPLFMYVNEANLYIYQADLEMKLVDADKEGEEIEVYAYPPMQNEKEIVILIKSYCPLNVEIIRVWINDECYNLNLDVQGMMYNVTDPVDITEMILEEGTTTLLVKVTTSRGNVFSSKTNPLYYTAGSGWSSSGMLSINIVLLKENPGTKQFSIKVTNNEDESTVFSDDVRMIGNTASYIQTIYVPDVGSFHIRVTQHDVGVITEEDVLVSLENPVVWVYSYSI